MTYKGTRAREADDESKRIYEVSKIRLAADGRISHVLWAEVDARSAHDVSAPAIVPVVDAIDAIRGGAQVAAVFERARNPLPERFFVVARHDDGSETIGFDGEPASARELSDMATLDDETAVADIPPPMVQRGRRRPMKTFAVSKVELDADGRVVAVRWGRVDTAKNTWAADETVAPVAEVVKALHAGDPVFALFPSTHGHVPDRQFVSVDYDDGRQTIVLDGPSTHEREIHDMDRIDSTTH